MKTFTDRTSRACGAEESRHQAFFKKYCLDCHSQAEPEGNLSLESLDIDLSNARTRKTWEQIHEALTLSKMPPKEEPSPTPEEMQQLVKSIEVAFAQANQPLVNKLPLPGYGNYVSHDMLFHSTSSKRLPDAPPRLWRIRPEVLNEVISKLTKIKSPNPLVIEHDHEHFSDFAVKYALDRPTTEQLLELALKIAAYQTEFEIRDGKFQLSKETRKVFNPILNPSQVPTQENYREVIVYQFEVVLRRSPSEQEYQRLLNFFSKTEEATDRVTALRAMLASILLLPEAIYRMEGIEENPDSQGLVKLSGYELVHALSYGLLNRPPYSGWVEAAERGELESQVGLKKQIEHALQQKHSTERMLTFFQEFFGYKNALQVFKDEQLFFHHDADVLVGDTDQLVLYILKQDQDVFHQLMTTNLSFVNWKPSYKTKGAHGKDSKLIHLAYNLPPDWKWKNEQPLTLPQDERCGILTQPSWLVAHSDNFNNHAIRRGKCIQHKLLAGTVPDVPITVNAQLPDDESLTLRERMKITRAKECWKCHQQMDPFGLPLEQFDHFGRFRTQEQGEPVIITSVISTQQIAENNLTLSYNAAQHPEPKPETIEGPIHLIRKLAGTDLARQSFIRHAFRFWMGRNETLGDAKSLQEMDSAYQSSNGSMKSLLIALFTSDSFLYRKSTTKK